MNRLDQHADIVTQNLAEDFVDHAGVALAPNRITEFCLAHREHRFDVGTPVVVRQEVFPLEHEVMIHPAPGRVLSCGDMSSV